MGFLKIVPSKGHRCTQPGIFLPFQTEPRWGVGTTWQCDTCGQGWELAVQEDPNEQLHWFWGPVTVLSQGE